MSEDERREVAGPMLDDRELACVLAALRHLESTAFCKWVTRIYNNDGTLEGLTAAEINKLCERLNAGRGLADGRD